MLLVGWWLQAAAAMWRENAGDNRIEVEVEDGHHQKKKIELYQS